MNLKLNKLNPYPFEKLRVLLSNIDNKNNKHIPINLSIGEPKHPAPDTIKNAIVNNISGISNYPTTKGDQKLRETIANWIEKRYNKTKVNPDSEILPVIGSREALFSFAQIVINNSIINPVVICPNPFYQIYEGASLLAGAEPYYVNLDQKNNFSYKWNDVPEQVWNKTQLLYVCSPGNPAGNVLNLQEWKEIFDLSNKYNFVIASDECYSEIYYDESHPPLGALEAANLLNLTDYNNLVVFSSLSKRSNVPGLRSGFVAGDAKIINKFLLYRTYNGSAMSPLVTAASIAAWSDEKHVQENRKLYNDKIESVFPILKKVMHIDKPQASFYLWAKTPVSDEEFTRKLFEDTLITVLPGSFLARKSMGINPGDNMIRIALVSSLKECTEAANKIAEFIKNNY
ncbi:acetylornithine/N-succinyldiaminopimelate aminotransferase [Candidatus Kinetoplastibacterium desouzaii TCC079E]|uniref:Acetylornithine/N-succinyldiaminopimelate aminotransferase n=1 Tax=Candidatus Kinetoplastidibacterium desouzai TCC079E TaxID=1208919 RepID=M1M3H7_9PROT|nr:succinyldiaminopimelate transaminase [Candidatus Kinetoplastibacterium desouzaii]AGF46795.1 acetylornithine/N-succinyldiaminopimelate aminotransferase [Candidatus Kinetoplastibacterium desouzaii TCC079E]